MTLDPERDLQRIHSLIISHIGRLETLIQVCKCEAVYTGAIRGLPAVADPQTFFNMMLQLREISFQIEQKHRSYQRSLARETKYGSK